MRRLIEFYPRKAMEGLLACFSAASTACPRLHVLGPCTEVVVSANDESEILEEASPQRGVGTQVDLAANEGTSAIGRKARVGVDEFLSEALPPGVLVHMDSVQVSMGRRWGIE